MPKQWIYILLLLFVAYLISLDPVSAGTIGNSFFGWMGGLASSALEFVDALVDGPADPPPPPAAG